MADVLDEAEPLMDSDLWVDVAAVAGGFIASGAAQSVLEGPTPFDVPNEAFGVFVAVVVLYLDLPEARMMAIGAGMNSVDAAAQRIGIQNKVTEF